MDLSIVIPTRDQMERLRLVLCGLREQSLPAERFEVLVIDDGCTDGTVDMIEELIAQGQHNLRLATNNGTGGRSSARNAGMLLAQGELVVFLDGDALPSPDLLATYWEAFTQHGPRSILCGLQHALVELEYFQDPQIGSPLRNVSMPSVVRDFLSSRREELVVTEEMIRTDFATIQRRSFRGSYPNEGTQRRQDEARELVGRRADSPLAWVAFIPHNGAIPAAMLKASGGFDEQIPFSEGWELALRLQRRHGARLIATGAMTYHLYHHHRFDDEDGAREETLVRRRSVEYMAKKHADPRIRLLYFWYAHLWSDRYIPEEAAVDLLGLERLYEDLSAEAWAEYEIVLANHPAHLPEDSTKREPTEVAYETCV